MTVEALVRVSGDDAAPERIRYLLYRKAVASNRHHACVARSLRMSERELAAITYLADRGALTPGELGELLGLTSGGVTALTQRLERLGYVERLPHPRDKRSCLLRATPPTVQRVAQLFHPLVSALDELLAAISADDRRRLAKLLDDVSTVFEHEADAIVRGNQDPATDGRDPAAGLWC